MLLWTLFYIGHAILAFIYLVGGPIGPRFYYTEAIAASITLGAIISTWLVFIFSALLGNLNLFTILLASLTSLYLASSRWKTCKLRRFLREDTLALSVTGLLSLVLLPTYCLRMIPLQPEGWIKSGGSCYGDLPIHMTIANSFLDGCNKDMSFFNMHSPIFAGRKLTYPFLPDFHAAVIVALGGTLRDGFLLPGFSLCCALWVLVFFFTLRVSRSRLGSIFSVFMVIGAGGLGVWRWVMSEYSSNPSRGIYGAYLSVLRDKDVIQHDPTGEWKYLWFAFVPHIMLPQRGANFAYPLVMLVLILVWMATDHSSSEELRKPTSPEVRRAMLVSAGVLSACLPLFQAHSFIGVGIIVGIIAVLDVHKWAADSYLFVSWIHAGIAASVLALPQLMQFRQTVEEGYYGKFFTYGWLFNNYEFGEPHNSVFGLLRFWVYSLGTCVPLILLATATMFIELIASRRLQRILKVSSSPSSSTINSSSSSSSPSSSTPSASSKYSVLQFLNVQAAAYSITSSSLSSSSSSVLRRNSRSSSNFLDDDRLPSPVAPSAKALAIPLPFARDIGLVSLDVTLFELNALSPSGRNVDILKLILGAILVFLISNYINFQPWDRDNAKIYYIFIFIAAPVNGAFLAAPFEYIAARGEASGEPGFARVISWCGGMLGVGNGAAGRSTKHSSSSSSSKDSQNGLKTSSPAVISHNREQSSLSGVIDVNGTNGPTILSSSSSSVLRQRDVGSGAGSNLLSTASTGSIRASSSLISLPQGKRNVAVEAGLAHILRVAAFPLFALSVGSGLSMLLWEFNDARFGGGSLLDQDAIKMGEWIKTHVARDAVIMHSNYHVQPSGAIAARPSLVAYFGWVSNHGYNANERLGDRDYVLDNCLKDSDENAYFLMRKWGVRYVLGEHLRTHPNTNADNDPDLYLDGKLQRKITYGRYDLLQVL